MNDYLPTYEGCMMCGHPSKNPAALNVRFKVIEGGVQVRHTLDKRQEGYKGVCHGGVQSALLDETLGWAVAVDRKRFFMTMELNVRFVRPLPVDIEIIVNGRSVKHKSRMSTAEGEIIDVDGTVYAKATAKYYLMDDEKAKIVNDYLLFQDGDLDILADTV